MNALVVYSTKFGNTEQIARAIAAGLGMAGSAEVRAATEMGRLPIGIDLVVIGGPTQAHGMDPAIKTFLDGLGDDELQGVEAAAFDTRYRIPAILSGSAARRIAKVLARKGARLIAEPESFFVQHSEGPLADGEIERAGRWAGQLADAMRQAA